jgi:antitoxin ParD1/3/4
MAKAEKRSVSLTPDLDEAIQRRIASGSYASRSEVIRAGLRALEREEEERERKLALLDSAIERGLADAKEGRVLPVDAAFDEVRKQLGISEKDDER